MRCYASGIAIAHAFESIADSRTQGFAAFKVKVGFDAARDTGILHDLFDTLMPNEVICADANQAWTLKGAQDFLAAIRGLPLGWLEEPLPADAPQSDWLALANASTVAIAAGENITGTGGFSEAIASGVFDVIQPDLAKWGGFSGCWPVAQAIRTAGLRYCPHFLGGGIGLLASAHLLAATGGDGMLEVDVNPNPLRDGFEIWQAGTTKGTLTLPERPGLGITAFPDPLRRYVTFERTLTA
ncbi:mandelate racemase/muconate lactonizing enzyme family protein [Marivita sp. S2033]|uniref:mandelate racemase/muconate lactonizing enzyme family protein n=1 Tax=Marivita sp. S2033 TaxID=3373187 RepID=UPI0039821100